MGVKNLKLDSVFRIQDKIDKSGDRKNGKLP